MPNCRSSIVAQALTCAQIFLLSVTRFFQRLVFRKNIHSLNAGSHSEHILRPGVLNLFHLVGIGLGGTIGTGIFVFTGHAAGLYAGPSVIISYILAGIVALLAAFSYSEMASIMVTPGSAYTYSYVALGEYPAFLIGWLSAFPYQFGASVAVVRWSRYVVHVIHVVSGHNATEWIVNSPFVWSESQISFTRTGHVMNLPAIAITLFITALLIWGVRETVTTIFVLVIFKLIALLIFIVAGCIHVDEKNYIPFFPSNTGTFNEFGFTGMLRASTYVFYAYIAFETVSIASKESKSPTQYIPYATIISLVISALMYLGISTVMVGLVHYSKLNTDIPMHAAVRATTYGLWFSVIMDLGAIASLTTVATTILYAQTRIFFTMARDGLLPKVFTKVHAGRKTPWVITLVCGAACAIMSGFFPLDILGEIASIGALITFLVVHICVIVLRYKRKDIVRDFRGTFDACPWLIPSVGALLCILLLIPVSRATGIRFGIWMGLGHLVYFGYGFRHSKERKAFLSQNNNSTINLVPVIDQNIENPMAPATPALEARPSSNEDEPATPSTIDDGIASLVSESDQSSTSEEEQEVLPPPPATQLRSVASDN